MHPADPSRAVSPSFVLVETRSPGNVGSAARVLDNLGFRRLVLAMPACDPADEEAYRMAVGADGVVREAEVHEDLDGALRACGIVVGTSRRAGKHRKPHDRFDDLAPDLARASLAGERVAILFGREDHGLSDEQLDRCTHLAYLPANEAYPSFNLAQAVAIVGWVLARALEAARIESGSGPGGEAAGEDEPLAGDTEREAMYRHLESALLTIGFLHRDSVEPLMRRLRRLIGRATPTVIEARMLRGIARQVLWAAGRAGLPTLDRERVRDERTDRS
jgi:tRNA/rRNA methyltransferase/tRNA (cytidine32/uridine32-2'-O)-methyltransferase